MGSIRLAVLDDNLYVRTPNGIRPESSRFHAFVEAVARTGQFKTVTYLAPVRELRSGEREPVAEPVDESLLRIVPTAYFSGIGDYLLRAGYLVLRNWRAIDRAIADADLIWLRLPASNALLALAAGRRHGVPHFAWVAGSVGDVARTQPLPAIAASGARLIAFGYDEVSDFATRSGPAIKLDGDMFASVVPLSEVEISRTTKVNIRERPPWRIVWSGRMAAEKGLQQLIEAIRLLQERNLDVTLSLIGDGSAKPNVERIAASLPHGTVEWHGYVTDESRYFALLREADLFVYPTQADAVPKVVVEALAAGVPVLANDVGAIRQLVGDGQRGRVLAATSSLDLATAIVELFEAPDVRRRMRVNALDWAAEHTDDAQARRLVDWLSSQFPNLRWDLSQ